MLTNTQFERIKTVLGAYFGKNITGGILAIDTTLPISEVCGGVAKCARVVLDLLNDFKTMKGYVCL